MGVGAGVLPDVEARFQVAEQRADNVPGYHVVDRAGTQALLLGFAERVAGKALGVEHCGAGERVLRRALGVEGDVAAFGVAGEQQGAVPVAVGKGGGGGVLYGTRERRAKVVAPVDVCGHARSLRLRAAHGDDGFAAAAKGIGDKARIVVVVLIGEYAQL